MVLSSCCGVGSLRTGTLIIGALNLVLALLVLPLAGWCAADPSVSEKIQGDFFNWPPPENVSRLAPPKNAWTGPPLNL